MPFCEAVELPLLDVDSIAVDELEVAGRELVPDKTKDPDGVEPAVVEPETEPVELMADAETDTDEVLITLTEEGPSDPVEFVVCTADVVEEVPCANDVED